MRRPAGTPTWPLPARVVDHLTLETPSQTAWYWLGLGLIVASLFVSAFLPCVDYPQHLALADIARRLSDPNAPEHAQFVLNYFTYNGLFHVLVAKLGAVLPIELAGRLVLAASLSTTAAATLALLRVLGRPPVYAALFTPIVFSFSVAWGFANFALGTALALVTLVFVARALIRPSVAHALGVAVFGLSCAFAHVLAMIVLCLVAASLAPELSWWSTSAQGLTRGGRARKALVRGVLALAPLLIGCVYCIGVYCQQYEWDPNMYRDPTLEGTAPPLWQKVIFFGAFATDLHSDGSDQVILVASLAFCAVVAYRAWRARREQGEGAPVESTAAPWRGPILPFVVLLIAYLATPMVLVGTHLIFPRLAQWLVLGIVLAVPAPPKDATPTSRRWLRACALGLGVAAGANVLLHTALFAAETNDASRVIDELPEGRRATAVIWNPRKFAYRNGTLVHLAAYYAARKRGDWAFSFARYLSVPVRFKPGGQPAWPERGWEFAAEDYNPRCKYARVYDLVMIKAPPDIATGPEGEGELRRRVFGRDADAVRLLSHHGKFWAFDTAGLPEDGAL